MPGNAEQESKRRYQEMGNMMKFWREHLGLVVIFLVVLAVLSGQLPAHERSHGETSIAEGLLLDAGKGRIAIMVKEGACGTQLRFDHIMSCVRGE